jgi:hypothetical protein
MHTVIKMHYKYTHKPNHVYDYNDNVSSPMRNFNVIIITLLQHFNFSVFISREDILCIKQKLQRFRTYKLQHCMDQEEIVRNYGMV